MLLTLAEAEPESAGGKAVGLRRLLELGLPVPEAFCLPASIYREALPLELPRPEPFDLRRAERVSRPIREHLLAWQPSTDLQRALEHQLAALFRRGAPLVVRSSASCEDLEQPSAGLFTSTVGVRGLASLLDAVRRSFASLWDVPAWAGLHLAGRWPGSETMAIIVQRQVEATWAGLLISRDPADERRLRIEAVPTSGEGLAGGERDPEVILLARDASTGASTGRLAPELVGFLRGAAVALEAALGGAVELEWAHDGTRPYLLQVRRTRVRAAPRSFPLVWRRPAEPHQLWRWDREHNPDPLSPAHQSLIERIDSGARPRLMVQAGYLYTATSEATPAPREPLAALWQQLTLRVSSSIASLDEGPADPRARLQSALGFFTAFYERYAGELAAARLHARVELRRLLAERGALEPALLLGTEHATARRTEELWQLAHRLRDEPEALEAIRGGQPLLDPPAPAWLRGALEAHLRRYGCLTRRWDLASPTLAEEPERLRPRLLSLAALDADPRRGRQRAAEQAARAAAELAAERPADRARLEPALAAARLARRLEEDDDLLFAQALGVVRRALLAAGTLAARQGWLDRGDEIFWLTLDETHELLAGAGGDRRAEVEQRRRALEANRRLVPPLSIAGDRFTWPPPAGRAVLRGAGVGGVAQGPVRLASSLEDLLGLDARGAVIVCPTLLPSLAVVLAEAAALVTDHGGLLSHAASLARELGVPAVVGTGTATRDLRPGEQVWVDGSRGLVVRG